MRHFYSIGEKRKILRQQERESLNNSQIAALHGVTPTQIRRWKQHLVELQQTPASKKTLHRGRDSNFADIEEEIYRRILELRRQRLAVTVRKVVQTVCELRPEAREKSFFNLQRWVYRFLERRALSLRRVTRNVTIPDPVLQARLTRFNEDVAEVYAVNPGIIWVNMDQTAVQYEMPIRRTVDFLGIESVQIQTTGNTSARVTIALAACSTGEKLPLFVVFKGTRSGRIRREFTNQSLEYPRNVVYDVQENAWTDEAVMVNWVGKILTPFVESHANNRICLILDSLVVHRTQSVLNAIESLGVTVLHIPGGLTSYIQPMDVGVNAPFKHWIREEWSALEIDHQLSPAGKRVRISQICSASWDRITPETICNSFNNLLSSCTSEHGERDMIVHSHEL